MFFKTLAKITIALGYFTSTGCNSIVQTHQARIEKLYTIHEEIIVISNELQNIEQVMLYVGRIKEGQLADYALDVAIAIHGEPDDLEKLYAQNITRELIEKDMAMAKNLMAKRQQLLASFREEKTYVDHDIAILEELETKYEFVVGIISKISVGIVLIIIGFVLFKAIL